MRIPLVVSLTPLALVLACSDQGPIQGVGPKLTISPERVSVETGADPITLQAVPQNGDLTGSVTWAVLSGAAGTLGPNGGQTVTFTPTELGTPGGAVVITATATVGGTLQPANATVTVVPSTHGRIVLGIDPGDAVGSVDVTDPSNGSKTTFVADAPVVRRSGIIDAGTYTVTADAGISVIGNLVDGIWDGTAQFDGGAPARSVEVPVRPNAETTVSVSFALRGGQGRLWIPVDGAIRSFTENQLLVDHASENGISVGGIRAVAFDADGNLWATFSGGIQMFTPEAQAGDLSTPARTVTLANATGIAIRGDTVAVATCSGSSGGVSTFSRSDPDPAPAPVQGIAVGCIWGISYDVGNNGKLWIASRSQGKVYRYNAAGTASDLGTAPSVSDAYGLAVDSGGSAWVTSCSGNSVVEISPTGEAGSPLSLPDFSCPAGVALDKQENLWVVSEGTADNGNLVQVTGGNGTVQLNSLTQVTFGGVAFNPGAAGLPTHP
jgi:ligand-binding sensor domain-containing protein